jgi:hypothetical protein
MTDPVTGNEIKPREWQIGNRTLIVSAEHRRVLGVLNARDPLPLFPGTILQFDDGLGDQRVVGLRVIAGRQGGIVCVEVEPAGKTGRRAPQASPRRLRAVGNAREPSPPSPHPPVPQPAARAPSARPPRNAPARSARSPSA